MSSKSCGPCLEPSFETSFEPSIQEIVFEIVIYHLINNSNIEQPKRLHYAFTLAFPFYARKNKGKETQFAKKFGYKVRENKYCKTYECNVYDGRNKFVAEIRETSNFLSWYYNGTLLRTHTKSFTNGVLDSYKTTCNQIYAWYGRKSYFIQATRNKAWVGKIYENQEVTGLPYKLDRLTVRVGEENIGVVVDEWKDDWLDFKGIAIRNTLFPANIKQLGVSDLFKMAWTDVPLNF